MTKAISTKFRGHFRWRRSPFPTLSCASLAVRYVRVRIFFHSRRSLAFVFFVFSIHHQRYCFLSNFHVEDSHQFYLLLTAINLSVLIVSATSSMGVPRIRGHHLRFDLVKIEIILVSFFFLRKKWEINLNNNFRVTSFNLLIEQKLLGTATGSNVEVRYFLKPEQRVLFHLLHLSLFVFHLNLSHLSRNNFAFEGNFLWFMSISHG